MRAHVARVLYACATRQHAGETFAPPEPRWRDEKWREVHSCKKKARRRARAQTLTLEPGCATPKAKYLDQTFCGGRPWSCSRRAVCTRTRSKARSLENRVRGSCRKATCQSPPVVAHGLHWTPPPDARVTSVFKSVFSAAPGAVPGVSCPPAPRGAVRGATTLPTRPRSAQMTGARAPRVR